jgi:cyclic pyranopterin monophosphate synthase
MARMADTSAKAVTARRARAVGTLRMGARAFALLKAGRLPKGDAVALAQAAGVMAAKKTPELLPLCHPISLDAASVEIELDASLPGARVACEAVIAAKTGVEMEALTGATAALLCLYDLVKPVDPALEISGVRLEFKEGGKKGLWRHPKAAAPKKPAKAPRLGPAAAITVSDRASRGAYADRSGPILAAGLKEMGFTVTRRLLSDDEHALVREIARLAPRHRAIVLTGGTGLSPRDRAPEAVTASCDRLIPGFGEALRASGPVTAPLSRAVAGLRGSCVIVALPGSPGGVRDGLALLRDLLPHAVHTARGGGH